MVSAVLEAPTTHTIVFPLSAKEARDLTDDINTQAEQLRQNLLRFFDGKGWAALGYDSFKAWAIQEFKFGFQHAYTLMRVARIENDLSIIEGNSIAVPVNVGKQLAKLPTAELQLEAHKVAETHALTAGRDVTEKDAIKAVAIVEKREFMRTSQHKVVAQMVNEDTLSAQDGARIVKWLDQSPPPTQLYVQEKMAAGLRDLKVIHEIVNRHRAVVRSGEASYNLNEIDRTGRIAGVPLDRATEKDWDRMAAQNQQQRLYEALEKKRAEQLALAESTGVEPEPIVEPKAMNAYTNSPVKTLSSLKGVLDDKTLDGLFALMAQERGYVQTAAGLTGAPDKPIPVRGRLLNVWPFERNGLECASADTLEMLVRVKR